MYATYFPRNAPPPVQDKSIPARIITQDEKMQNDSISGGIKQSNSQPIDELRTLATNQTNAFLAKAKQSPFYQGIITLFRNPFVQISMSIIFILLFGYIYYAVIKSQNNFYNPRPQFLSYCMWMWIWLLIIIIVVNFAVSLLYRH